MYRLGYSYRISDYWWIRIFFLHLSNFLSTVIDKKGFLEIYSGKRPYRVSRKVLNRILNNILKHKKVTSHFSERNELYLSWHFLD